MPAWEDLSGFFSTDDFAVAAVVNGSPVKGIFDNAYLEQLGPTPGTQPQFVCAADSVPGVAFGATAVIESVTYKVIAAEPDGTGLMLLRLERQ